MKSSVTTARSTSKRPDRPRFNRLPGATYRLQFNAAFTLDHGTEVLDYLCDLGITDVYASPLFQAAPESAHGYDVCSHENVSAGLGSDAALKRFADALRERGMGLLLDIVPNHMGASAHNTWWWDVLRHGRNSNYAHFFDIDWESPHNPGKVLLPVLGDRLPKVIEIGRASC